MDIHLTLVFWLRPAFGFSGSCQDGFEHLFPHDEQGGHVLQTFGKRFIAARVVDFAHQILAAQLFQVVSGLARGVIFEGNRSALSQPDPHSESREERQPVR